jgi:septin family protein
MNVDLSPKKPESTAVSFSVLKKKFDEMNKWRIDRGRVASNIGTLKIAVAGDSGIGKTTLIETFYQISEASTHPLSVTQTTPLIKEFKFSTIPPNEIRTGEDPYNLTFVDISGYGQHPDAALTIKPALEYCVGQFQKTDRVFVKGVPVPNLVRFLNAGTGSHTHVDICIYAILHRLKPIDIEYMRVLSPYTHIIPLLIKSDTLTTEQIFTTKKQILEQCNAAGIQIYGFGLDFDELCRFADEGVEGTVPFAVNGKDADGEFECFKQNLLYWHVDDLRQLSADKFLNWRNGNKR